MEMRERQKGGERTHDSRGQKRKEGGEEGGNEQRTTTRLNDTIHNPPESKVSQRSPQRASEIEWIGVSTTYAPTTKSHSVNAAQRKLL